MENIEENKIVEEKVSVYENYLRASYAKLARLSLQDLRSNKKDSVLYSKYSRDDITKWLKNPEASSKNLRAACNFLYLSSHHFRRIVEYFARMPLLSYIIIPYGTNDIKNKKMYKLAYNKVVDLLNLMNIQHEFKKILTTIFIQDIFFGYIYETLDSFFIKQLPTDFCLISSVEDSVYNLAFDFNYFSSREDQLENYGEEFVQKYWMYKGKGDKKGDMGLRWQELDSLKTIVIKLNEEIPFPAPPFAGVLESIYSLEDHKALFLAKTELENTRMLSFKIPLDENNQITMDDIMRQKFYGEIGNEMPDRVGYIISPFDVKDHVLTSNNNGIDTVSVAETEFYNSVGVSQMLFNNEKASSAAIKDSITSDFDIVCGVLRQLERWITRKIKNMDSKYKFKCSILNVSNYNKKDVFAMLKEAATYGTPVKMAMAAVCGYNPSDLLHMGQLENEILELRGSTFSEPLLSSNTLSSDINNDGGRPESDDDDLGDDGIKTKDSDANKNRV